MMVLSGTVHGGNVFTQWPGLRPDQLYGPGDLQVTTDFRSALAESSQYRLQDSDFATFFPNHPHSGRPVRCCTDLAPNASFKPIITNPSRKSSAAGDSWSASSGIAWGCG